MWSSGHGRVSGPESSDDPRAPSGVPGGVLVPLQSGSQQLQSGNEAVVCAACLGSLDSFGMV